MNFRALILVLPIIFTACQDANTAQEIGSELPQKIQLISPVGQPIEVNVEIADTPEKQRIGLMHRTSLDADKGMLFIFGRSFPLSLWMKNTLIPLDIMFFDADMQLVSVKTMYPCTIDTCPYTRSDGPAKYALEVAEGFAAHHGVGPGWMLSYDE
ncbi:MAG: DUF192 domain-containing protein [bacterium]|nr:DUF192 domain-containing protein [bacterium]